MVPVVISAPSGRLPEHLLSAVPRGTGVLVLTTPEWELDHLRRACSAYPRFLFLKESVAVLSPTFWRKVGTEPAWLFPQPSCYLAVYDAATLLPVLAKAPKGRAMTKRDSITWESRLQRLLPAPVIFPDVTDWNAKRVDVIDGRQELIIGNDIVEKAKSTARCKDCPTVNGICSHFLEAAGVPASAR